MLARILIHSNARTCPLRRIVPGRRRPRSPQLTRTAVSPCRCRGPCLPCRHAQRRGAIAIACSPWAGADVDPRGATPRPVEVPPLGGRPVPAVRPGLRDGRLLHARMQGRAFRLDFLAEFAWATTPTHLRMHTPHTPRSGSSRGASSVRQPSKTLCFAPTTPRAAPRCCSTAPPFSYCSPSPSACSCAAGWGRRRWCCSTSCWTSCCGSAKGWPRARARGIAPPRARPPRVGRHCCCWCRWTSRKGCSCLTRSQRVQFSRQGITQFATRRTHRCGNCSCFLYS